MSYELINTITTNTLASFEHEADAQRALEHFAHDDPAFAEQLMIVRFDDQGEAVEGVPANERSVSVGAIFTGMWERLHFHSGGPSATVPRARSRA
jgi:hypothetical protein